jgi:hypothetical protein
MNSALIPLFPSQSPYSILILSSTPNYSVLKLANNDDSFSEKAGTDFELFPVHTELPDILLVDAEPADNQGGIRSHL